MTVMTTKEKRATVGFAAGVGLLLVVRLLKQFTNGEKVQPEGFALAFGITRFIQTVLGMMGEPALL